MILFENCCYNFHQNGFLNITSGFKLNSNYNFDYKSIEISRYACYISSKNSFSLIQTYLLIEQFE
jgi:hypothetical protein